MKSPFYRIFSLFVLSIALNASVTAKNKTVLPATIDQNTVLNKAGSPYTSEADVWVTRGTTLHVKPGVEIFLPDTARLYIKGNLQMIGSAEEPIRILPAQGVERWGAICFYQSEDTSRIEHAYLQGAFYGYNRLYYKGAISGYRSTFVVENVETRDVYQAIYGLFSNVTVRNCLLDVTKERDANVNVVKCNYGRVILENCEIFCPDRAVKIDAIDFGVLDYGLVKNNTIHGNKTVNSSDGIDLDWCRNRVYIEDNFVYNCQDKGISIGAHSYATVRRNIITGCRIAVAIKDSAFARLENNTFYNIRTGVYCYEKTEGDGGGFADVYNTIISDPSWALYQYDHHSQLSFYYCLSDDGSLPGKTNISADPGFVDPANNDFRLKSTSPCIDAGDPDFPLDPDGSQADIGACAFNQELPRIDGLVINEILLNKRRVELYNRSSDSVWTKHVRLSDDSSSWPVADTLLPSSGFMLIDISEKAIHKTGAAALQQEHYLALLYDDKTRSVLIDQINYPDMPADASYGRFPDGSDQWHVFNRPSPKLANIEPGLERLQWQFEKPGWHFLSLPGTATDMRIDSLFPLADSPALVWNGHDYTSTDTLKAGQAFWLNIPHSTVLSMDLFPLHYRANSLVQPGWHMVGSAFKSNRAVISPPEHALTPLYAWDPNTETYVISDSLKAQKGYWIAVYDSCNIATDSSTALNKTGLQMLQRTTHNMPPPPPRQSRVHATAKPERYTLQNFPNPFNSSTTIQYTLPKDDHVEVKIFNLRGEWIKTLFSGEQTSGRHGLQWNGMNAFQEPVSSAIYFIRLQTGSVAKVIRVVLLK